MKIAQPSKKTGCSPGASAPARKTVSLPVVASEASERRPRMARWRSYSLVGVHVLMIAHFLHWLWAGQTLTPIEPSESMETIRQGSINMGFIFFSAAILATFLLGRWVCGWGCHLVAYQDLTLWILKKLHLRPKAFRTRFLFIFTTLVLAAGWMFFLPLGARLWSMALGEHQPELALHLSRTGYWDTFPGPLFGALTIFVGGMAIVYFLGPKGFCTYACPYGAIFAVADRFSPMRIRVNDACNQCGQCTAVCTSNVDVAQEVNVFKMVVDPGCMKCMDCVEACPNDALRVGFGRPALFLRPQAERKARRFDLSLGEEIAALVLFVFVLVTVNGLYGEFPYLLSLAIAGILTYLLLKGVRLLHAPDVMIQKVRLKVDGRLRGAGWGAAVLMAIVVALLAHSAVWRYHDLRAGRAFRAGMAQPFEWQYDPAFAGRATTDEKAALTTAARHYEAMQGWGLVDVSAYRVPLAWCYVVLGRSADAAAQLRTATQASPEIGRFWLWRAKVETHLGDFAAARASFEKALAIEREQREPLSRKVADARHELSAETWSEWGRFLMRQGDMAGAERALADAVRFDPGYPIAQQALVDFYLATRRPALARRAALAAIGHGGGTSAMLGQMEAIRVAETDYAEAIEDYRAALKQSPDHVVILNNLATALLGANQADTAMEICRKALRLQPDSPGLHATMAGVYFLKQDIQGMIREYETVHRLLPGDSEAALKLAMLYHEVARTAEAIRLLESVQRNGSPRDRVIAGQMLDQIRAQG